MGVGGVQNPCRRAASDRSSLLTSPQRVTGSTVWCGRGEPRSGEEGALLYPARGASTRDGITLLRESGAGRRARRRAASAPGGEVTARALSSLRCNTALGGSGAGGR
jgi:hypothetical protein